MIHDSAPDFLTVASSDLQYLNFRSKNNKASNHSLVLHRIGSFTNLVSLSLQKTEFNNSLEVSSVQSLDLAILGFRNCAGMAEALSSQAAFQIFSAFP